MASTPTSFRLDESVKQRLKARAEREGIPTSTLAERLIDEGLRMADHPGIRFRGGPAGRRATLIRGPDVAEVVSVLQHLDVAGEEAIAETARWLELPHTAVQAAVDYYAEYTEEIEAELAATAAAAREAHARWERRRQLLS